MSTTGVPSIASIGPIRRRFFTILHTVTRWRPRGLVGGERGKDVGAGAAAVGARMDLQDIAPGSVEPGDDDDFVAGGESQEPFGCEGRFRARRRGAFCNLCFGVWLRVF